MPLPRSVTEMSKDDFNPRRVESQAFRGFSFVQDDFALPARPVRTDKGHYVCHCAYLLFELANVLCVVRFQDKEVESYWRNIEEDGESVSECASSKFGEEMMEPPKPEKKKRPPRKRKKKNANSITPTPSTNVTPAPSEVGETASETNAPAAVASATERAAAQVPKPEESKTPPPTQTPLPTSAEEKKKDQQPKQTSPKPKPKPKQEEVWEEVSVPKKKGGRNTTSRQSLPQRAVPQNKPQRTPQAAAAVPVAARQPPKAQPAAPPVKTSLAPAPAPNPYKPTPGSWAAKIHRSGESSAAPAKSAAPQASAASRWASLDTPQQQPHRNSLQESPMEQWARGVEASRNSKPSSDWRQHSMSSIESDGPNPSGDWRRHSLARNASSSSRSGNEFGKQSWPSLGSPAASPPAKQRVQKGAWASKLAQR